MRAPSCWTKLPRRAWGISSPLLSCVWCRGSVGEVREVFLEGVLTLKDGSIGCWFGVPCRGLLGHFAWVREHVEDCERMDSVFPAVKGRKGPSPSLVPGRAALLPAVRVMLRRQGVLAGVPNTHVVRPVQGPWGPPHRPCALACPHVVQRG